MDAGDPYYLNDKDHLNHVAATLLRVRNMRGFAMNTGFFANMTFVETQARAIACKTGLTYVTDTGRNGGDWSRQELDKIAACRFDPPNVKSSNKPMWGLAAMTDAKNGRTRRSTRTRGFRAETTSLSDNEPVQRGRFSLYREPTPSALSAPLMGGRPVRISNSAPSGLIRSKAFNSQPKVNLKSGPKSGGSGGGKLLSRLEADAKMSQLSRTYKMCTRPLNKNKRSDGYIWARSNGESDGRLAK